MFSVMPESTLSEVLVFDRREPDAARPDILPFVPVRAVEEVVM